MLKRQEYDSLFELYWNNEKHVEGMHQSRPSNTPKNKIESHQEGVTSYNAECAWSLARLKWEKDITLNQFRHQFIQHSYDISISSFLSVTHMYTAPICSAGLSVSLALCTNRGPEDCCPQSGD